LADPPTPGESSGPSGEPGPADVEVSGLEPEPGPPDADESGLEPEPSEQAQPESEEELIEEPSFAGASASEEATLAGLMDALRQAKVAELLLSTASTLASVAYGKLEVSDLDEAKAAIDAIGVILPLLSGQLDAGILRDFEQALANLRLAYADAIASRQ
jgi:hypothetical protein